MKIKGKEKVVVILGPTASGKSALAIELAKKFNGEVISADSRQVYRGLDIGTGKVTKKEMQGIPHHLLDVADPRQQFTAAQYKKHADKTLRYIVTNKKVPIVCGGTGFYIDALLGTFSLPEVPVNTTLRKTLSKKSASELFKILKKKDSRRAREIDKHNPVRLIRAIEIAEALGKVPKIKKDDLFDTLKIGIAVPPDMLREKIHARLLARIQQGMVAEAQRLHKEGVSWKRMEALGLEYRYLARHLKGELSKEEMVGRLETKIGHYAKRQMTWFKKDANILWVKPSETRKIENVVKKFLKE